MWELITVGAAIFTALLIVGVQITFYTRHFEGEYSDKVEKIKLILNWKLEKELRRLFRSKFEAEEIPEGDREWTQVFPETLEDIRFKEELEVEVFPEYIAEGGYYEFVTLEELDTIVKTVSKLKKWSDCITNGKDQLRNMGEYLIIIGITILIGIISYAIVPEIFLIAIFGYIATLAVYKLHENIGAYRRILTEIDETYKKVQKRSIYL